MVTKATVKLQLAKFAFIFAILWTQCFTVYPANVSGTAQTLYSGTQNIICYDTNGLFILREVRETTPGNYITIHTLTWIWNNTTNSSSLIEITNTNTNWDSVNWVGFDQLQHATDVHIATGWVLDYFSTVHNRNGICGTGLLPAVNTVFPNGTSKNAAGYCPDSPTLNGYFSMGYGDGDGRVTGPSTSIDIVAHEVSHGINQFSANLWGGVESGALSEGFSDIWGVCVKNYVNEKYGLNKNLWLHSGEIMITDPTTNPYGYNCIRDIRNPKSNLVEDYYCKFDSDPERYPNTYKGINWKDGYCHRNSTVLSHWFFIICSGKKGSIDDMGVKFYNVAPLDPVFSISINKAERIAYRTLTKYLNQNSTFYDMRDSSIKATEDLFGKCSPEVITVRDAWYAVGLGYGIKCDHDYYIEEYMCRPVPFNSSSINKVLKPIEVYDFRDACWYLKNVDSAYEIVENWKKDSFDIGKYVFFLGQYIYKSLMDSTHFDVYLKLGSGEIYHWRINIVDATNPISHYLDMNSPVIVNPDGKSGVLLLDSLEASGEYCIPLNCKDIAGNTLAKLSVGDTNSFETAPHLRIDTVDGVEKYFICFQLGVACSGSFTIETDCNGCPELFRFDVFNKSLFQKPKISVIKVCTGGVLLSASGADDCGAGLSFRWVYIYEEEVECKECEGEGCDNCEEGIVVVEKEEEVEGGRNSNSIEISKKGRYRKEYFHESSPEDVIYFAEEVVKEEDIEAAPLLAIEVLSAEYGYLDFNSSLERYYCVFDFRLKFLLSDTTGYNFLLYSRGEKSDFAWDDSQELKAQWRTKGGLNGYYLYFSDKFECELREYKIVITDGTGEIACELLIPVDCKCYDCFGLNKQFMVKRDEFWGKTPPFDYEAITSVQTQYSDDRGLCSYTIRIPDGVEITGAKVGDQSLPLSHIKTDVHEGYKYFEYVTVNPCDSLKYPNKRKVDTFELKYTNLEGDTCETGFRRIFVCVCGSKPPPKDSVHIRIPPPWTGPVHTVDFCIVDSNGVSPPPGSIAPITADWQFWIYNSITGMRLRLLYVLPVGSIPCGDFNFSMPLFSLAGTYMITLEEYGQVIGFIQFIYDGQNIIGVGVGNNNNSGSSNSNSSNDEEDS